MDGNKISAAHPAVCCKRWAVANKLEAITQAILIPAME
jgi:hypothetical protein